MTGDVMAQGLIRARRKLKELYRTGVEIRVGGRYGREGAIAPKGEGPFLDEDGKPVPLDEDAEVAMWVQPPSPLHREQALRDANAARARAVLRTRTETDSEEHLAAMEFITQMSEETLYEYVLVNDTETRRQDAIREVLAEDEWKDITELQESLRIFEEEERPEDDPEVKAVRDREEKLSEQVAAREKELREAAYDVLKMRGVAEARKQAVERRAEIIASQAFMKEYERQMRYYSVRDIDDHGVLFFESARELAAEDDELRDLIDRAADRFIKDGNEAKNSQGVESGLESSALPSEPETTDSSTPEASIA
jgi:hypothetical protein